jgi:hypothetical protein
VWIAGDGGALARRATAAGPFTSFDGQCQGTTWNAAWVRPSNGRVYLAGNSGRVAEFNGTTCTTYTVSGASNATGIVGFETGVPPITTVRLYVVDVGGRLHSWIAGSAPQEVEDFNAIYRDVHGLGSSRLFFGGQDSGGGSPPLLRTYTGSTPTVSQSIGSWGNNLSIRGVWMTASNLAYAVGDGNLALRWNGSAWSTVTPPGTVAFTSVCAPDPSSVYTTDAAGVIRRNNGTTWVQHHASGGELRDIAVVSPTNVWAVGPSGRVVHFPEP